MAHVSAAVQLGSTRRRQAPLPPGSPWYKRLWRGWQRVAHAFGDVLSRVVTTLMYLVGVTPFAIGVRLFSDPLELKPRPSRWTPLPPQPSSLDEARRGL
jgi:hypothetical protein